MARKITPNEYVLVQSLGDQAVALNLNDETYYALNGIAYEMWQMLIVEGKSREEVITAIQSEYNVPSDVLRKDLDTFIQQLSDLKFILVHDS